MRSLFCKFLTLFGCWLSLAGPALAQTEIIVPFPEPGQTVLLNIPARSNLVLSAQINANCVPNREADNLVYDCTPDADLHNPSLARTIVLQGLLALPREQMPTFTLLDE